MRKTGGAATIPKVSVVIPCLNAAETLGDQLQALADQVWDGTWEVVIADNGSVDGSIQIARSYANRLPSLRVVDASGRPGAQTATNVGVGAARGDHLLLLDADDEAAPGYLAAMAVGLDQHDLVAARYDCETLNASLYSGRGRHQTDGLMNAYAFLPYAGAGGLGVRRTAFDLLGGFDAELRWLFDVDFCWRAQESGLDLAFVPDAVVRVRFRSDNREVYKQARNWASCEPYLYRRHRSAGMNRAPVRASAKGWLRTLVRANELLGAERRNHYLANLGRRVGRLQGSWRNRVLYL